MSRSVGQFLPANFSLFSGVSRQPTGPFFKGQRDRYSAKKFRYTTDKQSCVTSQKTKDLTYTPAETINDVQSTHLPQICNSGGPHKVLKSKDFFYSSPILTPQLPATSLGSSQEQFTLLNLPLKSSVSKARPKNKLKSILSVLLHGFPYFSLHTTILLS